MKKIIFYLLILMTAVLLGLAISAHSGTVLITLNPWSMQMPLWFAVAVLALSFFILHYFIRLLLGIGHTFDRWRLWQQQQKIDRANRYYQTSIFKLIEDDWDLSESYALKALQNTKQPVLVYLLAAFAADRQKAYDRRDRYIAKARLAAPESEMSTELFLAKLQIKAGQLELARARLEYLRKIAPKNKFVLRLLIDLYEGLEEWQLIVALLPDVKRVRLFDPTGYFNFSARIYRHILENEYRPEKLKEIQKQIPRKVKKLL